LPVILRGFFAKGRAKSEINPVVLDKKIPVSTFVVIHVTPSTTPLRDARRLFNSISDGVFLRTGGHQVDK